MIANPIEMFSFQAFLITSDSSDFSWHQGPRASKNRWCVS